LPRGCPCAGDQITEAIIKNALDYGAGDSDVVAVHAETIGYHIIDSLREHGLTISGARTRAR